MAINGISGSAGINAVLAQLRAAQARTQGTAAALTGGSPAGGTSAGPATSASAADALAPLTPLRGRLSLSADDAGVTGGSGVGGVGSFGAALKASLDQVSAAQNTASALGQKFEKGEGGVDLNDVMVSMQKANVGFQAAVQVRNRLVSAYHDIMNMQL
jgi:flagellar hook-basal body complex protein FliE